MLKTGSKGSQTTFLASLTTKQYSQVVTMLQLHLQTPNKTIDEPIEGTHVIGTRSNTVVNTFDTWVIDFGAISHIS